MAYGGNFRHHKLNFESLMSLTKLRECRCGLKHSDLLSCEEAKREEELKKQTSS